MKVIDQCVDCGRDFDITTLVGMGSPPRMVCLKCFEARMQRTRQIMDDAAKMLGEGPQEKP